MSLYNNTNNSNSNSNDNKNIYSCSFSSIFSTEPGREQEQWDSQSNSYNHGDNYSQQNDDSATNVTPVYFEENFMKYFPENSKSNDSDYETDEYLFQMSQENNNNQSYVNIFNTNSKSLENENLERKRHRPNNMVDIEDKANYDTSKANKSTKNSCSNQKKKSWKGPRCEEALKAIKTTSFTELVRNKINLIESNRDMFNKSIIRTVFKALTKNFVNVTKKEFNKENLDKPLKEIMINFCSIGENSYLNDENFDQIFSEKSREILKKTFIEIITEFKDNESAVNEYLNSLKMQYIDRKVKKSIESKSVGLKSEEYVHDYKIMFRSILSNFRNYLSTKKIDFDFYYEDSKSDL